MRLPLTLADAKRLAAMSDEELAAWLAKCSPNDLLILDAAFEMWAQQGQLPPQSDGWRVWLMMAGRGFGKTRAGAEWIHGLAMAGPRRIALVGATIDEARRVMVEGMSGLLAVARRNRVRLYWEPSLGRIKWRTGSVAQLFSGDNPDGLRGPEHHFAWGAAANRSAALPGGRRTAVGRPAGQSAGRLLLPGGERCDRCLGGTRRCAGEPDRRRLEIYRAGRGCPACRCRQRPDDHATQRYLGKRDRPGPGGAHQWPGGGQAAPGSDCRSHGRRDGRRRVPRRGGVHSFGASDPWPHRVIAGIAEG